MKIAGLQKLTLLDYPGKIACTVFAAGCNYRCPFCQNADLVLPELYPEEIGRAELSSFLKKRAGILDGICISGGEPLLTGGAEGLMEEAKALGYLVKLDTNGSFPERLESLAAKGLLDYVAMDLKNSPERYAETVGLAEYDLSPIRESVSFLLSGAVPYEFRTTVVREFHGDADFLSIGEWIQGARRYFLPGFVDSGNLIGEGLHGYSLEEMERLKALLKGRVPNTEIRGY